MIEVYYYLPAAKADNIIECGLKLSKWFDKEVNIGGDDKKCISSLLTPKDDIEKYRSGYYRCLKLELLPNYCFVADKYLYQVGLDFPEVMDMYRKSITPIQDYTFGTFRLPECLVTCTVIPGQISSLGKRLDSPVLFDSSEELYVNNIIQSYRDEHKDFNDVMLYFFYCKLAETGKAHKIEDKDKGIAVFFDETNGRAFTIKIPEISAY